MYVPNGFKTSDAARRITYDEEGRLREQNISRMSTGGVGDANSLYKTDAERFQQVAPFLHNNIMKDRPRRNYMVQQGGAILFNGEEPQQEAEFITDQESFGHNTLEEAQLPTGGGNNAFTISDPGRGVE